MNTKYWLKRVGRILLATLLLIGIPMIAAGTAQAQGRFRGRVVIVRPHPFFRPWYPNYYSPFSYYNQYVFGSEQAADSQGYHDGLKTGASDAHHGKSYDPERSHYFHDAGFGNFAEAYRTGFTRGYDYGFRA